MKNIIEIVHDDSMLYLIKKSKLNVNNIIKISPVFSISNITEINKYIVNYPSEVFTFANDYNLFANNYNYISKSYNFSEEIKKLNLLKHDSDIRIWCSHMESDSYILLCYIVSLLKDEKCDIFVVYSDEYKNEYTSPNMLNEQELFEASKLAHKLTDKEKIEFSTKWNKIIDQECNIRIIRKNEIELIDYEYFDDVILTTLNRLGICSVAQLVCTLMGQGDQLIDLIYAILIYKLIEKGKIHVVGKKSEKFLKKLIST